MSEKIGCVQHDCAECVAREQREWVGLTAEDRWEILFSATEQDERVTVMQLVEAKLKERNT